MLNESTRVDMGRYFDKINCSLGDVVSTSLAGTSRNYSLLVHLTSHTASTVQREDTDTIMTLPMCVMFDVGQDMSKE